MAEYYTTISSRQVKVLEYAKDKKIHITQSMLEYLNALAAQKNMLMKDSSVEDFRKTISRCVGDILGLREKEARYKETQSREDRVTLKDYKVIENEIERAFRQICAIRTNKYLKVVKKELDDKPASREPLSPLS